MLSLRGRASALCHHCYTLRVSAASHRRRNASGTRRGVLMSEDDVADRHAELEASDDHYDGKLVASSSLPSDPGVFASRLRRSLQSWSAGGTRGVWLKLGLGQSSLIPEAVEQGFVFHHAEAGLCDDDPLVAHLTALHTAGQCLTPGWRGRLCGQLPGGGARGSGAERGAARGRGVWKMPTGLVAAGEDLTEAAERELREETGVTARVEAVLAVRQAHGFAFGKSDMFVVLGMRPQPDQQQPVPQESELVDARWVPIHEYTEQEFFRGMPLYSKLLERCQAWAEGRYKGFRAERLESNVVKKRSDLLIWGEDDDCDVNESALAEVAGGKAPS